MVCRERTVHKLELRAAREAAVAKAHRRRQQQLLRGWQADAARDSLRRRLLSEVRTPLQIAAMHAVIAVLHRFNSSGHSALSVLSDSIACIEVDVS